MLANVMEHIRVAIGSQPNFPNLPNFAEGDLNLRRDGVVILRGALPSQEVRRAAALCDAAFTGLTTASAPSDPASIPRTPNLGSTMVSFELRGRLVV